MDMSVGENPEIQDLGAMPLALDAEVGFAGDEIEHNDPDDRGEEQGAEEEDGDEPPASVRRAEVMHEKRKRAGLAAVSLRAGVKQEQVPSKTATKPSCKKAQAGCPLGTKPRCPVLQEKLAAMEGELIKAKDAKEDELADITAECNEVTKEYEDQISTATAQLNAASVKMASDQASLAQLTLQGVELEGQRHEICEGMREKYGECYKEIKAFEEEICGIVKVRYATYQKLNPKIKEPEFQDCEVSGYTPGECSKTCIGADGLPGRLPFYRMVVMGNNTIGAPCPPLTMYQDCGEGNCPIDCQLDEWGGWSRCTKDCGGGTQRRSRKKLVEPEFGGEPCGEEQESQQCNTESCDQDCILREWTDFGACSKSCKPYWFSQTGQHSRKRKIKVAVKGAGTCPSPKSRERYNIEKCNAFRCPRNLKCIAPYDNILVMDGSGSLWYWSWYVKWWPTNFNRTRDFAARLIQGSTMEGYDAIDQDEAIDESKPDKGTKKPTHARYGAVLFSRKVQEISPLTGNKAELVKKIKAMKWPMSATNTHLALGKAIDMLKFLDAATRIRVITLITDGRPTNGRATKRMARKVRKMGIILKVVPVGRGISRWQTCQMASKPCSQNVERANGWWALRWQYRRFVAGICPAVAAA